MHGKVPCTCNRRNTADQIKLSSVVLWRPYFSFVKGFLFSVRSYSSDSRQHVSASWVGPRRFSGKDADRAEGVRYKGMPSSIINGSWMAAEWPLHSQGPHAVVTVAAIVLLSILCCVLGKWKVLVVAHRIPVQHTQGQNAASTNADFITPHRACNVNGAWMQLLQRLYH